MGERLGKKSRGGAQVQVDVCLCVIRFRIVLESRCEVRRKKNQTFECNLIKSTDYACTKIVLLNIQDAVIKW